MSAPSLDSRLTHISSRVITGLSTGCVQLSGLLWFKWGLLFACLWLVEKSTRKHVVKIKVEFLNWSGLCLHFALLFI